MEMRSKNQTMERVKFYNEMNTEMHGKGFKNTRLKRELDRLNPQSHAGSMIVGSGVGSGISVAPTGGGGVMLITPYGHALEHI